MTRFLTPSARLISQTATSECLRRKACQRAYDLTRGCVGSAFDARRRRQRGRQVRPPAGEVARGRRVQVRGYFSMRRFYKHGWEKSVVRYACLLPFTGCPP